MDGATPVATPTVPQAGTPPSIVAGTPAVSPPVRRLNVGCGRNILPAEDGWVNIDGARLPGVDAVVDLNDCANTPLPFADATFDEFLISHVLEHIPNVLPLMQELWRIAKPNATIVARVPYGSSDDAWEDPTHIRAYFLQSWGYFSQPYYWRADYSYKADWQPEEIVLLIPQAIMDETPNIPMLDRRIRHERNIVREMACRLRRIDPPRQPLRELQVVPPIKVQVVPA